MAEEKLKTLKDFLERHRSGSNQKDTNNIDRAMHDGALIVLGDIKQEAVKWIKELTKQYCKSSKGEPCLHCANLYGQISILEEFFNISEEDLK